MSEKNNEEMPVLRQMREIAEKAVELSEGKLSLEKKGEFHYELFYGKNLIGRFGEVAILEWSIMEYTQILAMIKAYGLSDVWNGIRKDAAQAFEPYLQEGKIKELLVNIYSIEARANPEDAKP